MAAEFDRFKSELEKCLDVLSEQIGKLGSILLDAKKKLSASDYERLEMFLLDRGLTRADIKAAIAVAEGKIDSRLFFAGVANSKILSLSTTDQKRLLSGEKFDLLAADRKTVTPKSWGEMEPTEKDQLLGPKGGGIRLPHEQITARSTKQKNTTVFEDVAYRNKTLTLTYGHKTGEIQLGAIVQKLNESGELDQMISDLLDIRKQYEPKVA
jgi:hypothetical protein